MGCSHLEENHQGILASVFLGCAVHLDKLLSVLLGYDQTITDVAKFFRFVGGTFTSLSFVIGSLWLFNEIVHTYFEFDEEFEERVKKRRYMLFASKWLALVVFISIGHYLSCDLPLSLMTSQSEIT